MWLRKTKIKSNPRNFLENIGDGTGGEGLLNTSTQLLWPYAGYGLDN
jgi:hypothetical protein